ncbi:MAG: RtcB family protein [Patescibacteria group bacterium]|nr:RtcB family protein [Patescibacteria group bacterium]
MAIERKDIKKINSYLWEIPATFRKDMKVPARFYANEKFLDKVLEERALEQLINTATLPGVQKYVLAMPDIHEGYGFPIGGVAAMDQKTGMISPGGVGYDINCGVRLLKTGISFKDVEGKKHDFMANLMRSIPAGLGRGGAVRVSFDELDKYLEKGASFAVEEGFGFKDDLEKIEENGCLRQASPAKVSDRAKKRGIGQLGTLGSGNHFLELQKAEEVFDQEIAEKLDIKKDEIFIMIHTGSRGLGHQTASDYIEVMRQAMQKYKISIPDPELACTPFNSPEGQDYFEGMAAAANFAWANRQIITELVRRDFSRIFKIPKEQISLIYDVAHNIAKIEGDLVVHRKGATRAFGPNNSAVPKIYREIGQPVIIPGSMGTASYFLLGTKKAEEETFGSNAHGAGRVMSRHKAKRKIQGGILKKELEAEGITIMAHSKPGLAEEAPFAYKNIEEVTDIIAESGISKKVLKLRPIGVLKG